MRRVIGIFLCIFLVSGLFLFQRVSMAQVYRRDQDYRMEIEKYIIDPCAKLVLKTLREAVLTEDESIAFLKTMIGTLSQTTYTPFIRHFKKLSFKDRRPVYEKLMNLCRKSIAHVKRDKQEALRPAKDIYQEEITKHVIKPCLKEAIDILKSENVPEIQAETIVKALSRETVSQFHTILASKVFGKALKDRINLYEIGYTVCIKQMTKLRSSLGSLGEQ